MTTLMNRLREEEDKLNLELEESHGNYEIMKVVFEKRIDLFNRFLKEEIDLGWKINVSGICHTYYR
jgi:hypothetical protein